jgi:hypothetical protein
MPYLKSYTVYTKSRFAEKGSSSWLRGPLFDRSEAYLHDGGILTRRVYRPTSMALHETEYLVKSATMDRL